MRSNTRVAPIANRAHGRRRRRVPSNRSWRTALRRLCAPVPHSLVGLCPRFSQLCELANDPAQRPLRDSPTERTALLRRCRRGRRAVGRLGVAVAARPGGTVEQPSESRQREHDEDCGERAEPAECRVVVIHARNSTSWPGRLRGVFRGLVTPRSENAESAVEAPSPPFSGKPQFAEFWFCGHYVILHPSFWGARLPRTSRIFGRKPGNRGPRVVGANLAETARVALLFRREPVS